MKDILINTIKNKIKLSANEEELLISYFEFIQTNKNDYLINVGSTSRYLYFVVEGYIRSFYVDNGIEITNQFTSANEFVTSFESFAHNIESKENVQCMSDCSLLRISKSNYEQLFKEVASWSTFCNGVYEKHILRMSERANSLQTLSASERYLKFLDKRPNIVQHANVKHLASYLGIKPQSLSRIRKEIIIK